MSMTLGEGGGAAASGEQASRRRMRRERALTLGLACLALAKSLGRTLPASRSS